MAGLAATLEPLLMRAWPALEEEEDDGWLFRAADGYTSRANSIHVVGGSTGDVAGHLERADRWYRVRGLPVRFRLHDTGHSAAVDVRLPGDFGRHSPTIVSSAAVDTVAAASSAAPGASFSAEPVPGDGWMAAKQSFGGFRAGRIAPWLEINRRIEPPVRYCAVRRNGTVVALGVCVVDGAWACVLDVVVDMAHRRAGHATALMAGIAQSARDLGATNLHLQVEESNEAARALYAALGFRDGYRYWYRLRDPVGRRPSTVSISKASASSRAVI